MADRDLLVWSLASLHAAGVTVAFVALGHYYGTLSDLLQGLDTLVGFAAYAYLWALTYLAGRWVLSEEVIQATVDGSLRPVLVRGPVGGALTGAGVLLGPLLLVAVPNLVGGSASLGSLAVFLLYGAGIALGVGAAFGLVLTLVDVAALALARRVGPG